MSVHGHSCRLHLGPAADSTPVVAALAQGPVLAPPTAAAATAAGTPFSHGSGLFFFDHVLPCSSSAAPIGTKLIGANSTNIPTWGFQKHTLAFRDKTFTHDFLLTIVATPLLDLDFFRKFQLCPSTPCKHRYWTKTKGQSHHCMSPVNMAPPPRSAATASRASAAPAREVRKVP